MQLIISMSNIIKSKLTYHSLQQLQCLALLLALCWKNQLLMQKLAQRWRLSYTDKQVVQSFKSEKSNLQIYSIFSLQISGRSKCRQMKHITRLLCIDKHVNQGFRSKKEKRRYNLRISYNVTLLISNIWVMTIFSCLFYIFAVCSLF